jgi:hypothetical protein
MALEVLQSIGKPPSFTHALHHDLESLIYVLAYAVAVKELMEHTGRLKTIGITDEQHQDSTALVNAAETLLGQLFASSNILLIIGSRRSALFHWAEYNRACSKVKGTSTLHALIKALLKEVQLQHALPDNAVANTDFDNTLSGISAVPNTPLVFLNGEIIYKMIDAAIARVQGDGQAHP